MQKTNRPSPDDGTPTAGWVQYRKFSSPMGAKAIAARFVLAALVVGSFAATWQTAPRPELADARPVIHVALNRVEIVGKREHPLAPAPDSLALSTRNAADRVAR